MSKSEAHVILGIHIHDRVRSAAGVQKILTDHGDRIQTRLGLHHVHEGQGSPHGLILVEILGKGSEAQSLIERLSALDGVTVKSMDFTHGG